MDFLEALEQWAEREAADGVGDKIARKEIIHHLLEPMRNAPEDQRTPLFRLMVLKVSAAVTLLSAMTPPSNRRILLRNLMEDASTDVEVMDKIKAATLGVPNMTAEQLEEALKQTTQH